MTMQNYKCILENINLLKTVYKIDMQIKKTKQCLWAFSLYYKYNITKFHVLSFT